MGKTLYDLIRAPVGVDGVLRIEGILLHLCRRGFGLTLGSAIHVGASSGGGERALNLLMNRVDWRMEGANSR